MSQPEDVLQQFARVMGISLPPACEQTSEAAAPELDINPHPLVADATYREETAFLRQQNQRLLEVVEGDLEYIASAAREIDQLKAELISTSQLLADLEQSYSREMESMSPQPGPEEES